MNEKTNRELIWIARENFKSALIRMQSLREKLESALQLKVLVSEEVEQPTG